MTTTYTVPAREKLMSTLKDIREGSTFLCQFPHKSATEAVRNYINTLHDCRQYYSSAQTPILKTLFKVFDQAYYSPVESTKTEANIAFLCGFIRHLPVDSKAHKEILDRMILIPFNPQTRKNFEIIGQNMFDLYVQNYGKNPQTDQQLENRFYTLIIKLADAGKPNKLQKQWLYDNVAKLASVSPKFKKLLSQTPKPERKIIYRPVITASIAQESPVAYGPKSYAQMGVKSRLYDRD